MYSKLHAKQSWIVLCLMKPYFKPRKECGREIRYLQSCLNIVVDMLAILISRAKGIEQIQGVVSHLVDEGLSIL